jgi:hypothetical protein
LEALLHTLDAFAAESIIWFLELNTRLRWGSFDKGWDGQVENKFQDDSEKANHPQCLEA